MEAGDLGLLTKYLNPEIAEWGGKEVASLTDDVYRRLPIWFGEDEADAKIIVDLSDQIENGEIISGDDAMELLTKWES